MKKTKSKKLEKYKYIQIKKKELVIFYQIDTNH